jgi:hypothetical protein
MINIEDIGFVFCLPGHLMNSSGQFELAAGRCRAEATVRQIHVVFNVGTGSGVIFAWELPFAFQRP